MSIGHPHPHPMAGRPSWFVYVTEQDPAGKLLEVRVEDWADRVLGGTWEERTEENEAAQHYARRFGEVHRTGPYEIIKNEVISCLPTHLGANPRPEDSILLHVTEIFPYPELAVWNATRMAVSWLGMATGIEEESWLDKIPEKARLCFSKLYFVMSFLSKAEPLVVRPHFIKLAMQAECFGDLLAAALKVRHVKSNNLDAELDAVLVDLDKAVTRSLEAISATDRTTAAYVEKTSVVIAEAEDKLKEQGGGVVQTEIGRVDVGALLRQKPTIHGG